MYYFPMICWGGYPNKWCAQRECNTIEEARDYIRKQTLQWPLAAVATCILDTKGYDDLLYVKVEPLPRLEIYHDYI